MIGNDMVVLNRPLKRHEEARLNQQVNPLSIKHSLFFCFAPRIQLRKPRCVTAKSSLLLEACTCFTPYRSQRMVKLPVEDKPRAFEGLVKSLAFPEDVSRIQKQQFLSTNHWLHHRPSKRRSGKPCASLNMSFSAMGSELKGGLTNRLFIYSTSFDSRFNNRNPVRKRRTFPIEH